MSMNASISQVEIIDAAVARILNSGRCISDNGSEYVYNGVKCPVGFYLKKPNRALRTKVQSWDELDSLLKPEVRGFPREFWQDLQNIHDWKFIWYWDNNRLNISPRGKNWIDKIKKKWTVNGTDNNR